MPHGDFVWYELVTPDPAAAADFYGHVVGWIFEIMPMPGFDYRGGSIGDRPVVGVMPPPPDMPGAPYRWLGYVQADDVDAMAGRVAEAGGAIRRAPDDIPHVGRFAVVGDPQGAGFTLFRGDNPAPPLPYMTPGTVGWHELATTEPADALRFYGDLFGWRPGAAIPMGPMGTYQLIEIDGAERGAIMGNAPESGPLWMFYFAVAEIDAAVARTTERGGTLLMGPQEVPGGAFIVRALDPQGVEFALVGTRGG